MSEADIYKVIEAGKEFIKERVKDGVDPHTALDEYISLILSISRGGRILALKVVKERLEEWITSGDLYEGDC